MQNEHATDLAVGWHRQGFTTADPFRAHRELTEAGYRMSDPTRAASPDDRPAGAIRLYAKGGHLYWLITEGAA